MEPQIAKIRTHAARGLAQAFPFAKKTINWYSWKCQIFENEDVAGRREIDRNQKNPEHIRDQGKERKLKGDDRTAQQFMVNHRGKLAPKDNVKYYYPPW